MKLIKGILILVLASQVTYAASQSGDAATTTRAPAGPSVNQNAEEAESQNNSGQGMSMIMGAGLTAMGASQLASQNYGTAAMLFAMAALSFIQGGEHGGAAGSASGTAADTSGSSDTLKASTGGSIKNVGKAVDALKKGVGGVKADLAKGTISVNGKEYPASTFSSPASMSAAGFNPDDIAKAMDIAAKVEKGVTSKMGGVAANGFSEGGGGGGSGVTYVDEEAGAGAGHAAAGAGAGDLGDRGPAQVAGMSKDFNGEPIGVAADSIFAMMNRRYILKEKQNAFINETDLLLRQK